MPMLKVMMGMVVKEVVQNAVKNHYEKKSYHNHNNQPHNQGNNMQMVYYHPEYGFMDENGNLL